MFLPGSCTALSSPSGSTREIGSQLSHSSPVATDNAMCVKSEALSRLVGSHA